MIFIVFFLFILIILGVLLSIIFILSKSKIKLKFLWIGLFGLPLALVVGMILLISFIVGLTIFEEHSFYKISEEKTLIQFENDQRIQRVKYTTRPDSYPGYLTFFEKENKVIVLDYTFNNELQDLARANPERGFENQDNNSKVEYDSFLNYMQTFKEENYIIINQEKYEMEVQKSQESLREKIKYIQSNNRNIKEKPYSEIGLFRPRLVYINSDLITENEFKEISECAKKIQKKDLSIMPDVLLYKSLKNFEYKTNYEELKCENPVNIIKISLNGRVYFNEKSFNGSKLMDEKFQPEFNIGYFDASANFVRDLQPDWSFYHFENRQKNYLSKENFEEIAEYQSILSLLFNEKQEPFNDYLQSCKNNEGENLFDLFKEKS